MVRSADALVQPPLLAWARSSSGLDLAAAAKKVQVKPEKLESWERGESRPSIKQLRKLGNAYKRPIAVFYLSAPPQGFQTLRDFRRLPGMVVTSESPELIFQIRRAEDRREVAIELYRMLDGEPPAVELPATLNDEPEDLALRIRDFLGVEYQEQVHWQAGYETFNRWRSALEQAGILVFQAKDVDVSEMRGFSIHEEKLPAIVVNIKDAVRGRVFTMLHEFTHIVLRATGLCNATRPQDIVHPTTHEQRVEVFCNYVAGATLVPRDSLFDEAIVANKRRDGDWTNEDVRWLADRYGVSREVMLRRLAITGKTSEAFYERKVQELQAEYAGLPDRREEGFAPPYRIAVSTAGPMFVRMVLNSYYGDQITASDVSDFLDVRLKHLTRIEKEVMGSASAS